MAKMSEIGITLLEYEENLHAYGRMDPLVQALKRELSEYGELVRLEVMAIEHDFDLAVFNNQTEGRF